ncbi:PREDICTED: somatostatin receptor type 5-like [Branchiostoma belcheri]|uniref:Somatostatin receptor type 5-like n=1 Tax=Branchiostoma belcheri TaxID=7741 RepID=A0A6P4Z3V0_BRABE|nr:PREDICTED: somatostatin receptor type 5-like [Branchiostoma belcheri]
MSFFNATEEDWPWDRGCADGIDDHHSLPLCPEILAALAAALGNIGNWSDVGAIANGNGTGRFLPAPTQAPSTDAITAIVGPALYGTVAVVGFLGNLLVIYTLLAHTKMKDATNYYILNLALADALFMLGIPFISASSAMKRWVFGRAACKIVLSMDAMNMFTTVFNLAVLSVDRHLATVRANTHSHWRRPKVATAVCLGVWLAAVLLSIPVMVVSDNVLMMDGNYMCMLDWPEDTFLFWYHAFTSYTFTMGFLVPLLVISGSYASVIRHLHRNTPANAAVARVAVNMRNKVTKTVTALIVTFVFCWLPFHVCQVLNLSTDLPEKPTMAAFHIAMVLSYANSCANPFLYVFTSQKFRDSCRAALCLNRDENTATHTPVVARRRAPPEDAFFEEEVCEENRATVPYAAPERVVMFETTV